jgi:hypothetical protein
MTGFAGLSDNEHRTVEEPRIVDLLSLRGWPAELHCGEAAAVRKAAQSALDGLVALGLAYRPAPSGQRMFDPVEVSNFVIWASRNRGDPTFERNFVASARRLVFESHNILGGLGNPPALESLEDARYRVTLSRRFNLADHAPGKRIRLRLPMPIEGDGLTALRTVFLPPSEVNVATTMAPGQINLTAQVPECGEITAGITATFFARSTPLPHAAKMLPEDERELYTRPVEGLIRVTDRIRRLAESIAGPEQRAEAAVERFWTHIINAFTCDAIRYDQLSQVDPLGTVLDTGIFDCRLGSALLIALCRARGIPAQMISGYMLNVAAPVFHTWLQVWIEGTGWIPVDSYCWGMTLDHTTNDGWRDFYLGRIDHRMVLEQFPRLFTGTGGLPLPPRWQILNYKAGNGVTTEFRSLDSGALVYSEHVEVERLGGVSNPA